MIVRLLEPSFPNGKIEADFLNNRIMISFDGSDDAFDIQVEKE